MYTRAHLQLISVRVMKKKIVIILGILLSFISCQKGFEQIKDLEVIEPQVKDNIYAISSDQAMTNLLEFLKSDSSQTKSNDIRVIGSITPISYNKIATKSGITDLECETLLYIANFENNQGYAILAGDTRIDEPVIAMIDDGYLSDATVYTALELANEERVYFSGYPLDGPGFYTTPETGDEILINPNTVVLYDDDVKDTLVGNFTMDDENPEIMPASLCVSYALNQIRGYSSRGSTIGGGDDDNLPDDGPEQHPPFDNDNPHGPSPLKPWTDTITSTWYVKQSVEPLLVDFKSWHQDSPFNNLTPLRREEPAPAGCFPLSIAKVMTYLECPDHLTFNNYRVDWAGLKDGITTSADSLSAASLLVAISSGCNSWYFKEGTFTFPSRALDYMRFVGFFNAHNQLYDFNHIKTMADNGKPIIIYAVPGTNITKSHSWNIDGYKIKERTITITTYLGTNIQEVSTDIKTTELIHCDFGWGGKCNGYYASGVFTLGDPNVEYDSTPGNKTTDYNNLVKIITY